ncbi:oligosaccharide flippase family protein [Clostridium sp. D43t1_170807_H7]|uniref:oligosaccharide flippase family protein n=1 Tax=Clostridium sp. D43t1_170807_H7 TaxID=2787140 RepID=UPI0018980D64|nr:oligosaccharide flippase family protein [Clostridium sp. D43t1_170807_H7]
MKVNQLKAGVILSYIGMIVQNLVSIIYTPIMLRLLGQSEYGLYNLVYSVVSYLGLLSFGFGSAFIRYYSRYRVKNDEDGMARINGMFMTIFCGISLITVLAGVILIFNVENIFKGGLSINEINTARVLMILMVINIAISFPASVFDSNITANEKYIFQRVVTLLKSILNPFLTLPLLLLGYKSISLVIVTTIITVGSLAINMWYCFKKLNTKFIFKNFDFSLMKEMWVFSFYIFLNMIVDQINWSIDKFLLGMFKGTIGVAIYSIGAQINNYYLTLSTSVSSVFIPKVHRIVSETNDNKVLTDIFTKVGRIQFIILSFVLTGFVFFGEYFVNAWAGEGYNSAYYIALILIIPVTIPLIQNLGIEIQRAKNLHKFRSIIYFFIAIANIFISIPLCKIFGGIGAAIGTALSLIIGNGIIMNIYYHKKVGLNIKYFWKEILRFVPGLIIPIICGVAIKCFIGINNIFMFIILGIMYTIIFVVSAWFIGMNEYEKSLLECPINKIKSKFISRR